MSNDALSWAWRAPLDTGRKFVLVALADHGTDHGTDHSGEDWTCWPAVARLQDRTGMGRSTVERHLKSLEAAGWFSRRRRLRPDGKLGVYVYVLHREALEIALAQGAAAYPETGEPCVKSEHGPCAKSEHGPCAKSGDTMRQIEGKPCAKSEHEEPLEEPLLEPSRRGREREPGDDDFERALAAYPLSGQARTDARKARPAWAKACDQVAGWRLVEAIGRYSAWLEAQPPGFGAKAFENWLSGEGWRVWLGERAEAGSAAPRSSSAAYAGPAELRAAIVGRPGFGDGKATSYLDPCAWSAEDRTLTARTGVAADWLTTHFAAELDRLGVTIARPRGAA